MYGWVRRETGGRFALEIRRLWGFECDPAGRCNTNIAGARFRVILTRNLRDERANSDLSIARPSGRAFGGPNGRLRPA